MLPADVFHRFTGCLGLTSTGSPEWVSAPVLVGLVVIFFVAVLAARRLITAVLTLRASALVPGFSRRLSKWVGPRDYSDEDFFRADGAGERWIALRKQAIDRLSAFFQAQSAKSIAWGNEIRDSFSDLRFTDANRVPFPFIRMMREKFNLCSVVTASQGLNCAISMAIGPLM
jgi:glutamate-1-semialdehyde 2,1-aminomutase